MSLAALYDRYGDTSVLRIGERPDRKLRTGELRIRVRAAGLNPKDVLVRKGKLRWLSGRTFPRGTGYDWAGEVIDVGPESRAQLGDRLFGMSNGFEGGTVAEAFVARSEECAPMPEALSFEDAAALPLAALTGLQALRDVGKLRPGQRVALLGASGGVGVFAIQLARVLGAHVTASSSAENLWLLQSLGAQRVIDYRAGDPLDDGPYDCVFDIFGNRSFLDAERALTDGGTYVSTIPSVRNFFDTMRTLNSDRRARVVMVKSQRRDLQILAQLVERGLLRPVVDSIHPLVDVAAAHARIETKRARGKVVVQVGAP
ncbi:MAG: NAD(P)-dependent alcohol dehydrogenase [Polyangia bacterium]